MKKLGTTIILTLILSTFTGTSAFASYDENVEELQNTIILIQEFSVQAINNPAKRARMYTQDAANIENSVESISEKLNEYSLDSLEHLHNLELVIQCKEALTELREIAPA